MLQDTGMTSILPQILATTPGAAVAGFMLWIFLQHLKGERAQSQRFEMERDKNLSEHQSRLAAQYENVVERQDVVLKAAANAIDRNTDAMLELARSGAGK